MRPGSRTPRSRPPRGRRAGAGGRPRSRRGRSRAGTAPPGRRRGRGRSSARRRRPRRGRLRWRRRRRGRPSRPPRRSPARCRTGPSTSSGRPSHSAASRSPRTSASAHAVVAEAASTRDEVRPRPSTPVMIPSAGRRVRRPVGDPEADGGRDAVRREPHEVPAGAPGGSALADVTRQPARCSEVAAASPAIPAPTTSARGAVTPGAVHGPVRRRRRTVRTRVGGRVGPLVTTGPRTHAAPVTGATGAEEADQMAAGSQRRKERHSHCAQWSPTVVVLVRLTRVPTGAEVHERDPRQGRRDRGRGGRDGGDRRWSMSFMCEGGPLRWRGRQGRSKSGRGHSGPARTVGTRGGHGVGGGPAPGRDELRPDP